jgi:hypothetical protein
MAMWGGRGLTWFNMMHAMPHVGDGLQAGLDRSSAWTYTYVYGPKFWCGANVTQSSPSANAYAWPERELCVSCSIMRPCHACFSAALFGLISPISATKMSLASWGAMMLCGAGAMH